jgi:aryl-alcohol dehydrogenase-like predicted oxidoreductase
VLPYFPLASGLLTGKYGRGEPPPAGTRLSTMPDDRAARILSDRNFERLERLATFAEARDHTVLDLAFAWLSGQPAVASVIAGATQPEQVRANVAAGEWTLSRDELDQLDA